MGNGPTIYILNVEKPFLDVEGGAQLAHQSSSIGEAFLITAPPIQ